jgi:hypothetical protein
MSLPGLEYAPSTPRTPSVPKMPKPSRQNLSAQAAASLWRDQETAMAFEEAREGDDSILLPYQPTPSINPPRPRTLAAGYDSNGKTLRIRFRDGAIYEYYNVQQNEWRNFKRVKSPGRFVNRVLNAKDYAELHL